MTTKKTENTRPANHTYLNNQQQDFNVHIEGRVGRLEGAVENLTHEVQETGKIVREMANGMGTFKESVLSHIGVATAPKWPMIVSFVMLILTILSLGGTIVAQIMSGQGTAIAKLDARVAAQEGNMLQSRYLDGKHDMWAETVQKAIAEMDIKLQREMKLINDTTESKISSVSNKLEHELDSQGKSCLGRHTELTSLIDDIKKWRLAHTETAALQHADILAKLASLDTKTIDNREYIARIEERQYGIAKAVSQLDYFRPGSGNMKVVPETEKKGIDK